MSVLDVNSDFYPSAAELESALDWVAQSPREVGRLEMIVARPGMDQRQEVQQAELSTEGGLAGDSWAARGSKKTSDGSANPDAQIAIMSARVIQAVAKERDRWSLAGDQLFVDLDISLQNLAPGDRLLIGTAILEVTALPHTGCAKFTERFGKDAIRWISSDAGREYRLRGMYGRVVQPGTIQVGDAVRVIKQAAAPDGQHTEGA